MIVAIIITVGLLLSICVICYMVISYVKIEECDPFAILDRLQTIEKRMVIVENATRHLIYTLEKDKGKELTAAMEAFKE